MIPFVGVKHCLNVHTSLKREALLFDKIAVFRSHEVPDILRTPHWFGPTEDDLNFISEYEWMREHGLVIDAPLPTSGTACDPEQSVLELEIVKSRELAHDFINSLTAMKHKTDRANVDKAWEAVWRLNLAKNLETRLAAAYLRHTLNYEAYPIAPAFRVLEGETNKAEVIRLVLNRLPIPDDTTSWEQILEFRQDPDTHAKFLGLRNWMSEISRGDLTTAEIEEKLEWLLHQYQRHLELHRLKHTTGMFEGVLITTAEVAENLIKLNLSQLARSLFFVKRGRVELLETELNIPGSEIAYVTDALNVFPSSEDRDPINVEHLL